MEVRFTQHLWQKLQWLQEHGFPVSEEQVIDVVQHPERVAPGQGRQQIAQKGLTPNHVLRVVYEEREEVIVCVTAYPGRRLRYESS